MRLPSQWTQFNSGDLQGFLHETHNVHFDRAGAVTLSRKPDFFYTENEDSDFGRVQTILYFNDTYHFITDEEIFYGDIDGTNLTKTTGSVNLATSTDAAVVFGRMYVTGDSLADYWNGTSWNGTIGVALTSGKHHPLCNFESQVNDKLAIGNGNTVTLYDNGHNAGNTLTLPVEYEVISIRYRNQYLYVGTKHLNGGEARIFIWDGSGSAAQYGIGVGSSWIFSMTEYGQSVAFVTNAGQLRVVEGTSIRTLANFPIYYYPDRTWQGSSGVTVGGRVLNRGMVADGDRIYICVNGENEDDQINEMYGGLWCYDPSVGLYHKAGGPTQRHTGYTASDLTDDTLTLSASPDAETGDPIYITNNGNVTGIVSGQTYYIIKVAANQIKIAQTRRDAHVGTPIQLTGSHTSFSARLISLEAAAEVYPNGHGAVALPSPIEQPKEMWNGGVIYGVQSQNGADQGVAFLTLAQNVGGFTTQKLYGSTAITTWQKFITHLNNLYLDNEQLIVKIKTENKLGLPTIPQNITWTSDITFTTDDFTTWGVVSVGDEIFVMSGPGAGKSAHVSSVSAGASNYTVTIDEAIGASSGGGNVVADNFKKQMVITNSFAETGMPDIRPYGQKSAWIQIKVEMRGYEISIPFFDLDNEVYK